MNITEIDSNFKIPDDVQREDLVWHDVRTAPVSIYGLCDPTDATSTFHRFPFEVGERVGGKVKDLNLRPAGGRVRFTTDSPYIALLCETYYKIGVMPHMPLSGAQGFDLYRNRDNGETVFVKPFMPPSDHLGQFSFAGIVELGEEKERSFTLNFPPYGTVKNLWIGLKKDASLSDGIPYRNKLPAVFYGSSITEGACASRPGLTYQAILSKYLNLDFVNLGFAGAAKGEPELVEYMAGLEMSCFVSDYDHNAPSLEHLQATLPPLYTAVREKNPTLPFVFMTAPGTHGWNRKIRRDYVESVWRDAVKAGDKNVYFVDGYTIFAGDLEDECTVEWCHPNDLGMRKMALALMLVFKKIYGIK